MKRQIFKLTALTNMHPGSGDLSYGVVDKLVQRDPATGFPTIHASGIKGSLKEYCENVLNYDERNLKAIFGDEKKPGSHKFFSAHILTLPVRSNIKPFFRATCPAILENLAYNLHAFGFANEANDIDGLAKKSKDKLAVGLDFLVCNSFTETDIYLEDWKNHSELECADCFKNNKWFGNPDDFAIVRDDIFIELCENLPVIARNRLEEPKNLWYEELIPRQSEFWVAELWPEKYDIVSSGEDSDNNSGDTGNNKQPTKGAETNGNGNENTGNAELPILDTKPVLGDIRPTIPLHIGANASVGQGYCTIAELFTIKQNQDAEPKEA